MRFEIGRCRSRCECVCVWMHKTRCMSVENNAGLFISCSFHFPLRTFQRFLFNICWWCSWPFIYFVFFISLSLGLRFIALELWTVQMWKKNRFSFCSYFSLIYNFRLFINMEMQNVWSMKATQDVKHHKPLCALFHWILLRISKNSENILRNAKEMQWTKLMRNI